jgi:hypothetical protein
VLELIKTERFQEEYRTYQTRIEKITDINIKNQATSLLKVLVGEVKKLDNQHQEMFSGNKLPMGFSDVRSSLNSTRKKLDTLLKDRERLDPKV